MKAPLSLEERKSLRRRARWTVQDFASYLGVTHRQAKRALARYNLALGGMLLHPSEGSNRKYFFYWAALAAHAPDAFLDNPLEHQRRVDALEDLVSDMHRAQRMVASQVGWVTREFTKMQKRAARRS